MRSRRLLFRVSQQRVAELASSRALGFPAPQGPPVPQKSLGCSSVMLPRNGLLPENVGIQLTGTRIAVPIAARAAARTCAEANGGPLLGLGAWGARCAGSRC